ncbi:tetratricopeptide repeat protein [Tepidibacillus fermentans]|uniref:Tetratricopeptide repeat protein n=1 Tax=Tepidibacillus fermentans TaxID=1281767 RepID=A0A4R3KKX3_9BACI|nr:tetratricopeptide repeat protein [Tepidibacillus fermentans]TCS84150.1 tetratricopeptide repeat protein [Tepidibacillus fermentans]
MKDFHTNRIHSIVTLLESGNYEEVLEQLNEISIDSLQNEEKLEIARVYLSLGFIDQVRKVLSQLKNSGINTLDIQRLVAELEYKEGNYDQALSVMHDLIEQEDYDDYDLVFLSQIYFDDGLPEVAYRYIDKAIKLNSEVPFYHYQKGLYAFELGNTKEALKSFLEAVLIEPDEPLYHLALGEAYYSVGQFEEALKEYDEVLTQHPDQEEALYLKGLLLVQMGYPEKGIHYLKKVAKLQPENLDILISLVDAYERNHNHSEAQNVLEKILTIDEYFLPALKRLGEIYLYQEEWQRAKEVLNKALEIDPDDITLHVMYAKILKAYGDVQEAIQQYELIHHDSPYEEKVCENLGDLYLKAGDVKKAIECYEKQLTMTKDPKIMNQLAACYAEIKDYHKALSMIEQSLTIDDSQEKLILIKEQILDLLKFQEG